MEWLGILLLYFISGFMKKREQNQKRKEIESDPEWDSDSTVHEKQETNLDSLLNDLFEQNPKTPEASPVIANVIEQEFNSLDEEIVNEVKDGSLEGVLTSDEGEFSEIDEIAEDFDNAVYDSKLADRKELHLGNKWNKKTDLKKVLFSSKRTLKKAVVLKEILDRPLALRE